MWPWIVGAGFLIGTISSVFLLHYRRRRNRLLAELVLQRSEWVQKHPLQIATQADQVALAAEFTRERLVRIENFLSVSSLDQLRTEAEQNIVNMVPSYIPTHKKGKTLSYESIHRLAHACLGFYHSSELQAWVSGIVGSDVHPTPDRDQSSLSVLCYNEAGDHINWHYDHNFYRGRHFTVLLSLANQSRTGGLSESQLLRRTENGDEVVDTRPNTLVIFEGARILHRATSTAAGDLRIMLSMTFCVDSRISLLKECARRIKDTAFYGLRALWD